MKSVPPPWRSARMRAARASRPRAGQLERAQLVGLRVEGDRADEVVRSELVEDGERGAPRVLHLLALRRGIRPRREAHAVRSVDHQLDRDRLAFLRLGGLREQLDGQRGRQWAVGPGRVAEQMRAAGDDERAATRHPLSQLGQGARRDRSARHVVQHDDLAAGQPRDAGGKGGGRETLHLHAAFRQRGGDHGRAALGDDDDVGRRRHVQRDARRAGERRTFGGNAQCGVERVTAGAARAMRQGDDREARQQRRGDVARLAPVDGHRHRGFHRCWRAALDHRLERDHLAVGSARRREDATDGRGGQGGRVEADGEHRHGRLRECGLGEPAASRVPAVAQQDDGGLHAVGAERGRQAERGAEVAVAGIEARVVESRSIDRQR